MWGYQTHFQISIKLLAENCFNKLAPNIFGEVFLVGVINEEDPNKHTICIEPEDCYFTQDMFASVLELSSQLEAVSPEKRTLHTHPIAQENHNQRIKSKALRDAVKKCIEQNDSLNEFMTYVSFPTTIEEYRVLICLQLHKKVYDSFYKLKIDRIENGRFNIPVSIIDALTNIYFKRVLRELRSDETGFNLSHENTDDLIKEAGNDFMYSISSKGDMFEGLHGLYERLNILSSLNYERNENIGSLLICPKDHQNVAFDLIFADPILMTDFRKVRKLLELTSSKYSLISDSYYVYGIGHQIGQYNPIAEDFFVIRFTGHYKWELIHDEKNLIKVQYNQPFLPSIEFERTRFFNDMKRIFKTIDHENMIAIYHLIVSLIDNKKGTILVISTKAEAEAERLRNQSVKIKPIILTEDEITKLSKIDGAILIDHNGICHSIGVILDGLSTPKGDSARGSRYNSSIRYYESQKNLCDIAIIIISDDGMVDFLPYLRPIIKKTTIDDLVSILSDIASSKEINTKKFNQTMEKIEEYSFYLKGDQCEFINSKRKEIEERIKTEHEGSLAMIIRNDLVPNPECNDSFFV